MFWGYICFLQGHRIESLAALSFPWTHHGIAWMILISFLPSYVSINLSWSIYVFSCNFSVKSNRGSGSRAFPTFTTSQLAKFIAIQTHIHHLTKLNYCITRTFLVRGVRKEWRENCVKCIHDEINVKFTKMQVFARCQSWYSFLQRKLYYGNCSTWPF